MPERIQKGCILIKRLENRTRVARGGFIVSMGAAALAACSASDGIGRNTFENRLDPIICATDCGPSPTPWAPPPGWLQKVDGQFNYNPPVQASAYGYTDYAAIWDASGHRYLHHVGVSNADGSSSYTFTGDTGKTASGTIPVITTFPDDQDYSFQGSTIHFNSSTQQLTVNVLNTGVIWTFALQNGNVIASSPGDKTITVPLSSLGYGAMVQVAGKVQYISLNCWAVLAKIMAGLFAAACFAAAILLAGCVGDGFLAIATCAGAQMAAEAIMAAAGRWADQTWQKYGVRDL